MYQLIIIFIVICGELLGFIDFLIESLERQLIFNNLTYIMFFIDNSNNLIHKLSEHVFNVSVSGLYRQRQIKWMILFNINY